MSARTVHVAAAEGLHARPAAEFARAAKSSGAAIRITHAGKTVDAASILGVLSLGAAQGAEVTIESDADGADEILDRLAAQLEAPEHAPTEA